MRQPSFTYFVLIFTCFVSLTYAQRTQKEISHKRMDLGLSVQVYPAGIIPTINLERYISKNSSLFFRLGGNLTDRQDFSDENDHEEGGGFGGSMGYRKHYPLTKGKIVAGAHLDAWNLWIDWEDLNDPNATTGTTYTLVLQPWLEVGYFLPIKNTSSLIGITAGFGREMNVITSGEDVAQDWTATLSLQYQFSLKK
ncbi:hypothetical protein DHD32_10620 [Arenibacter sp. TNZ]|jgi:hypothetical protein|uniref:hypothetical protein n=1 Tax=Arenibacter TaxID=178469 RepID=UPI000CD4720E|nr:MULTISPECIES: hypothetical protein [Arenibacter]MCM4171936.1 hypothetical protein [Arenibacter sp. TNZ]